jgi:hypothetical protein
VAEILRNTRIVLDGAEEAYEPDSECFRPACRKAKQSGERVPQQKFDILGFID